MPIIKSNNDTKYKIIINHYFITYIDFKKMIKSLIVLFNAYNTFLNINLIVCLEDSNFV
jgi:hypothetical protein